MMRFEFWWRFKELKRKSRQPNHSGHGFTLLEVMVAIAIFSFLMLLISQLLRSEISLFNRANKQNELEQKVRTAMMHVLDEIRLNPYTFYSPGTGQANSGIYTNAPDNQGGGQGNRKEKLLIIVNPDANILAQNFQGVLLGQELIYYDQNRREVIFRDNQTGTIHIIADDIYSFNITPVTTHLVQIHIVAGDPAAALSYELLTWARLY